MGVQKAPGLTYFTVLGAEVVTLETVLGIDVATEDPPQPSTIFLTRPYSL